jgi:hypothetical protein
MSNRNEANYVSRATRRVIGAIALALLGLDLVLRFVGSTLSVVVFYALDASFCASLAAYCLVLWRERVARYELIRGAKAGSEPRQRQLVFWGIGIVLLSFGWILAAPFVVDVQTSFGVAADIGGMLALMAIGLGLIVYRGFAIWTAFLPASEDDYDPRKR